MPPRHRTLPAALAAAGALLVSLLLPVVGMEAVHAAAAADGMTLSVDDGQALSGSVAITAQDTQTTGAATISVDGVEQTDATVTPAPGVTIYFAGNGWAASAKNTWVINGTHEIQPMRAYASWATGEFQIPLSVMKPGDNTVELRVGSASQVLDPAPGANNDFSVRNVRMRFPDGAGAGDPRYGSSDQIKMGDVSGSLLTHTWTYRIPAARVLSTTAMSYDADAADPGEHVITATSADGTRSVSATVRTGNLAAAPERIVLTPPADPSTAQSFTWRTGSGVTDGAVSIRRSGTEDEWRVVEGYVNETLTSGTTTTRTHSATVTGLEPGTPYEYRVGTSAASSESYTFTTAGQAGDPFTFIYFGDAQNDLTEKWAPVVQQAYEKFPDAVGTVNAGDLINMSSNDSEWTEWFDAMGDHARTTNVIAAPGNHEFVGDTFLKNWKSAFEYDHNGPQYDGPAPDADGLTDAQRQEAAYRTQIAKALEETAYYSDYQGVRFITLNASADEASDLYTPANLPACSVDCPDPKQLWLDMQAAWLDRLLADNPNEWSVATFHQPVFSTAEDRDEKEVRDTWLPVFQSNNIDLVLMGHDHTYARGFLNRDATATPGMTRGPVYAVTVSGPKYYEQQPADDNVWTRNGATQVVSAGHTSTFQGITVDGDSLHYESVVAGKWDSESTTSVPVGGTLDEFTITKYPSGAKRVTEEGVEIPSDPGTEPEEPEDNGLEFNLPNGSSISGTKRIQVNDAQSSDVPTIALDGTLQEVEPAGASVDLNFQAYGWDEGTLNTWVINGGEHEIVPLARYYDEDAVVSLPIPVSALHPGVNTIELSTGSALQVADPRPNANDDFRIKNIRLRFGDGTTAADPAVPNNQLVYMGDSAPTEAVPVRYLAHTWQITVPEDELTSGAAFTWDTTAVESGPHELTATSGDGTRTTTISVGVDNTEPVTVDVANGDVLRGLHPLTVTTDVNPTVRIDGEEVPIELRRRVVDPWLVFEGDGFQPAAAADSVWINGELFRVLRSGFNANGYSTVRVPIPWDSLQPGRNVIRIRSGSSTDPLGADVDVFTTRNTRLELSGGRTVRDPQYAQNQVLTYNNNVKFRDFVITVPDRFETVYQADWDAATYDDGEHTVSVTRPDGLSEAVATVVLDNSGPETSVAAPLDGHDYGTGSFVVDATATDPHQVASLTLKIDGVTVQAGQTVTSDDLSDGLHTFVAEAVDGLGNVSEKRVTFTSTGNLPKVPGVPTPVDGADAQSTIGTRVGVTVEDPTDDPMDVAFRWAYRGDYARGSNAVREGSSTTALPDRGAGDPVTEHDALSAADGELLTTEGDAAYPFQQFEIAVPDDLDTDTYEVEWSGSVPATQRAALSVWNHETGSWQLVADGVGADLDLRGDVSYQDTVRDGVARLLVQDVPETVIAEGDDAAVWGWVSDTQFYSERDPSVYQKQMQWVLDHRESDGIGYALHTGDIVNQRVLEQWQNADAAQQIWDDADMPYGLVPGNHDIEQDGSYKMYKQFFGEWRYRNNPWYGGGHDDNVQHYDVVSTPAADYLVLFIDWSLDQADVDWANQVLEQHPDYNAVIATHQYFNDQGEYMNPAPRIWSDIVVPNPNVDVVLSGHVGVWTNVKRVDAGRSVIEVMADYQSAPNNGDGWMRTMTFDAEAQTYSNKTLSVTHDRTYWKNNAMENFTLPVALEAPERSVATDYVGITAQSDAVIGTVEDVPSGTEVSVPAGRLQGDTRYSWYVEATDDEGFTRTSPVWDFSTGENTDETAPELTVPGDADLVLGDTFDPMTGVSAVDETDGDVTDRVTVEGTVDTTTPGTYDLTYRVLDRAGNETSKQRTVRVSGEFTTETPVVAGDVRVGGTLSVTTGTWTPTPSYSLQWLADGTPVPDATGSTLELGPGLLGARISVEVTGTKDGWVTARAVSTPTAPVALGQLEPATPEISGTPQVGRTLEVTTEPWTPLASLDYQWFADDVAIPGADDGTLEIGPAQVGTRITVTVTGSRDAYESRSVTSSPTSSVVQGVLQAGQPEFIGAARVDSALSVVSGTWSPSPSLSYAWTADGTPIPGASGASLVLTGAHLGKQITVTVTARLEGYETVERTTAPSAPVASGEFAVARPQVSGTARVDETLTVDAGAWSPAASLTYAWSADGAVIPGATGTSLRLTADLVGRAITVTVTGSRDGYLSEQVTSPAIGPVAPGRFTTAAPVIDGAVRVDETLTAVTAPWSPAAELSYQWLADGTAIAGATSATLPVSAERLGQRITVVVTGRRSGYADATESSGPTSPVTAARFEAVKPVLVGKRQVGARLTVRTGRWTPTPEFAYVWFAGGERVKGATDSSLRLTPRLKGMKVKAVVTATRNGYLTVERSTAPTGKVAGVRKR